MGRFELKLILVLIITAIIPLILTAVLVNRLLDETLSLAIDPAVPEELKKNIKIYKELFTSKKKLYRYNISTFAFKVENVDIDLNGIKKLFKKKIDDNDWLASLELLDDQGKVILRHGKTGNSMASLHVISVGFSNKEDSWLKDAKLIAKTLLPESYRKSFNQHREFLETYGHSELIKEKIRQAYFVAFFWVLMAVILFASLIGIILGKRVLRHLRALVEATNRVSEGELDFQIPVTTKDEIGNLLIAFNNMLNEIGESRNRIVYLEKVSSWQGIARRLAHEIKNPLTPIQLAVQELKIRYTGDDNKFSSLLNTSCEIVTEEIETLRRLVGEFSSFAKLPQVKTSENDLNELINEYLTSYSHLIKDVELCLELYDGVLSAQTDRVLLKRVIDNLIQNAVQASLQSDNTCTLLIKTEKSSRKGYVSLTIADEGPGIPIENQSRIFDPYFTTKDIGTGLGLAIVKKIVLEHKGHIKLDESYVKGACFKIDLLAIN